MTQNAQSKAECVRGVYIIIIINIQGWAIWLVPSPELQLLSPGPALPLEILSCVGCPQVG
jgi:hypothetical protein